MNLYSSDWVYATKPSTNFYFSIVNADSNVYLLSNDDNSLTVYKSNNDGLGWSRIYYIPKSYAISYYTNTIDIYDENTMFFPIESNNQINRITITPFTGQASVIKSDFAIDNIKMIDFNKGIAGHKSQIFITKDSWINCKTIQVEGLQSLWYKEEETIYYVSTSELGQTKFHITNDEGNSWQTFPVGGFESRKLYFIDSNIGFITGNINTSQTSYRDIIYRTSDGGKSWEEVLNNARNERSELNDIVFKDSNIGITTGTSNSVYITNNGGLSWQKQTIEYSAGFITQNSNCGYTKNRLIISVDYKGIYYIDIKKIK